MIGIDRIELNSHPPPGTCDLIYHTVDLIFALDCNAPPLFTLLTAYRDNIFARPTVAYNTAKEGPSRPVFIGTRYLPLHAY